MFNTYDSTRPYDNQMGYLENVLDRFWSKVKFEYNEDGTINNNACMIWTTGKDKDGYGQFWVNGKGIRSHIFVWTIYNGPILKGLQVLHKCDYPGCINPLHLWIGTNQENVDDKVRKRRQIKGSSHGMAVFEDEEVFEILKLSNSGMTQQEIADIFGVTQSSINNIITGRCWSHLTGIKYIYKNNKGENNGFAILNDNKVREIRQKSKDGRSGVSLAKEYCVTPANISDIKNNKIWTHVI
jgi:hypothetical protein